MLFSDPYHFISFFETIGLHRLENFGSIQFRIKEFLPYYSSPDALYRTAFEIFNQDASKAVSCDEFERVIRHTRPETKMDFDFNSPFMKRYFGP